MDGHQLSKDAPSITVSIVEYESLVESAREYLSLRQVLLAGGVTTETLDLLISSNLPPTDSQECPTQTGISASEKKHGETPQWGLIPAAPPFVPQSRPSKSHDGRSANARKDVDKFIAYPTPEPTDDDADLQEQQTDDTQGEEETCYDNTPVKRSLRLTGLPPFTTLLDVASVVRGGAILEMYLRCRNNSAHVSFVDPVAAEQFLLYAQQTDIHIKGKKVAVTWDQRQASIRESLGRRVARYGATRNLVIRSARSDMTADSIREDLEHIYHLEVVNLYFEHGHALLSLNSIQYALTARNCMHSRLKYKRVRIDFWTDECAQPLPPIVKSQLQKVTNLKSAKTSHRNRFELLFEGSEESP